MSFLAASRLEIGTFNFIEIWYDIDISLMIKYLNVIVNDTSCLPKTKKIDGFSTQLINCELPISGDIQVAVKFFHILLSSFGLTYHTQ